MSFSLFGSKSHEEKISLVLDIGSASVGAALILLKKKKTPKVLYSTRIPITIPEVVEEHDFTRLMASFVEKALAQVTTKGITTPNFTDLKKKDIQEVVCVFASPWFACETKLVKISEEKQIALTQKYVRELVKKETDIFTKKMGIEGAAEVIEEKIINTKLNGYLTSEPYNKKANDIELNLFLGLVPKKIIDLVEKKIEKVLHPKEIIHHSFSLIAYRTVTDLFPADSNSIIFDVTGEVTDISVIEDDVVTQTASVPFGRNTLVRRIAEEKKATNDIALSLLHLYSTEKAETKLYTEIDAIIADSRTKWKDEILKVIPALEEKTVFITADEDVAPIFKKYITVSDPRKIVVLNAKHFEGLVDTPRNTQEDVFISTATVFINNMYQKQN